MQTRQRFTATVGAVTTLGALALTGCGNETGGTTAAVDDTSPITLTMSLWDSNQQPVMQEMADMCTEGTNVQVDIELTPWDQYFTNLTAGAQGNTMPDVFWMHPEQINAFVAGDALMDLTDRIAEDNYDMSVFPAGVVESHQVDGRQYSIPKDVSTVALYFNKDLFDAAGVAYPDDTWTWDTWMEAAGKLTDAENGTFGMLAPANGQNFIYPLIYQNGSDFFDADGNSLFGSPETIQAVEFGKSFITNGYSPTLADFANTTEDQFFETGRAAMLTAGSWMLGHFSSIDGLNIGVAPLPMGVQRGTIASGMGWAIAPHTSHPDEAWDLVKCLGGFEANQIQAERGAAISVHDGTGEFFAAGFPDVDAQVFVDAADYGSGSYMASPSRAQWVTLEQNAMIDIFSGNTDAATALPRLAEQVDAVVAQNQ